MLKTEAEYQDALRRMETDRELAEQQRSAFQAAGLAPEEVERVMQPLLSFHAQLADEVGWYERVCRREFPVLNRLTDLGRQLIALRIAHGLSQRELARRLNVPENSVSRDERNEYHGITVERAQRVLDALNERLLIQVEQPEEPRLVAVSSAK